MCWRLESARTKRWLIVVVWRKREMENQGNLNTQEGPGECSEWEANEWQP